MLALIDNYDSFTYNLVQYLGELGADIRVFRNDQISLNELIALKPDHLVISPGPGEPIKDGGVSPEAIKHFTGRIPVLGVCLGHQCLGAVYGGKVDRAPRLMHGKTSPVTHNGQGVFKDIPSPFEAMRYHSLVVYEPIPAELEIVAQTSEGEIMALKHKQHPTYGVQFHPESILTEHGKQLLKNFLDIKIAPPASTEPSMLKPFIAKAINRTDLTAEEAEEAMNVIMTGQATQAQIGSYLTALRMKGETIPEITGSVRAMRAVAVKVKLADPTERIYDIVGTGGDGAHTFNISTAAAFILAGTGRKVAKHGNRAASSHCGSADVLSALGVSLDLTPDQIAHAIDTIGIGFMFAAKFHPAMKHAIGPRKEIGQRTIFNVLGPLTNPAGANIQLTGVYAAALTEPLANVLKELGSRAALIIYGAGGTDELNTCGVNRISHLKDGAVKTYDLDPTEFGFALSTMEDLRGGTPDESAAMMRDILSGKLKGARRDSVLLNAAGALAAETGDFKSALEEATASLDSGKALAKLNALVEYSQKSSNCPMSILEKILEHKKVEIAALDAVSLRRAAESSPAPRDFLAAIKRCRFGPRPSLIAELKRASPSKGILAPHLDLFQVADVYTQNGAAAISVLTDEKFFMGKLETLRELRFTSKSELPLLRKDFTIDEVQLYEARANGADAILLITAALTDDKHFADLHACALNLGLTALVEVHDEAETERALQLKDVKLIGINNRNLATFEVSLETTERIRPMVSPDVAVVAESGIFSASDVDRLEKINIDAILVGEALITSDDIPAKVRKLSGYKQVTL